MGEWDWLKKVAWPYTGSKILQPYRNVNYTKITEKIAEKITPNDKYVVNLAKKIISKHIESYSMEQLLNIFNYMKCLEYIDDLNPYETLLPIETLKTGKGDCDELAVATASLIGAVGGTVRLVTLFNNKIGHAFYEVHMGEKGYLLKNYISFLSRYNNYSIGWELDEQNHEWLSFDTLFPVPGCIPEEYAIVGQNKWNWMPNTIAVYILIKPSL